MNPTNNPIPTGPVTITRNKIIGLVAIAVVIVGAFLYVGGWSNLSPQDVLNQAALNTLDAKTLHTQATIKVNLSLNKTPQELTFKIVGDVDKTDWKNQKLSTNMSFVGFGLNGDADLKIIGRNLYLKINQFPLFPLVSSIAGKWLSFSENDLKELAGKYGTTSITSFDLFDQDTSKEEWLATYKAIQDSGTLADLKVSGTSMKDGVKVRTYTARVDKISAKKALASLARLNLNKKQNGKAPAMSEQEFLDKSSEMIDQTIFGPVIIDIGVSDNLIHGLTFSLRDGLETNSASTTASNPLSINIDVRYSNYNQNISIEPPTASEKITDLLNSYQKQATGKSKSLPIGTKK